MKPLEEMTDGELADALENTINSIEASGGSGDWLDAAIEARRRLSLPPAQRIADLTGCVVAKDENGAWELWENPIISKAYVVGWKGDGHYFILVDLPDDNRPWHESIYKPRTK